jgi:hypothetical protein
LHLDLFEQPARNRFFRRLLEKARHLSPLPTERQRVGVGALGRSLRRAGPPIPQSAFRIPQWWAPPCIWTFLSSLGKKALFCRVNC